MCELLTRKPTNMNYRESIEEQREKVLVETIKEHYDKDLDEIKRIMIEQHDISISVTKIQAYREEQRKKVGYYFRPEGWVKSTMFDHIKWQDPAQNSLSRVNGCSELIKKRRDEIDRSNKVPRVVSSESLCVDLSHISMSDLSNEELNFYQQYNTK